MNDVGKRDRLFNQGLSIAFVMGLEILRESDLDSLLDRTVKSVLGFLNVNGVRITKNGEEKVFMGEKKGRAITYPLTGGYSLTAYIEDGDLHTARTLRNLQALLTFHLANILQLERMKEMAFKDELTGAYLRNVSGEMLKRYESMAKRGKGMAVVFVDLDDLKRVNDELGHDAGDEYLRSFAESFFENTRSEDLMIRWGGDEFVLVFPGTTEDGVRVIMDRISREFDGSFSWGFSMVPDEVESVEEAVKLADSRMYEMKRRKKGRRGSDGDPGES